MDKGSGNAFEKSMAAACANESVIKCAYSLTINQPKIYRFLGCKAVW